MAGIFKRFLALAAALSCVLVLAACSSMSLTGSASSASSASSQDSVAQNRQYMSELNQMASDLSDKLEGFVDAVSRNDTVGMRTKADEAFQVITQMRDAEAPDDLTELQAGYMEACDSLENALNDYLDLYSEVADGAFDYSTYDERIKEIQDEYNSAVQTLEDTDNTAADLQK